MTFLATHAVKDEFVLSRQTDRHDEGNSRFSQFCERAKNILYNIFYCSLYVLSSAS